MDEVLKIFRLKAKEFSDISDQDVLTYINIEKIHISKKRFGDKYYQSLALLVAHRMKMDGYGNNEYGTIGDSIRLGSFSEGESSISFASNPTTNVTADGEYSLTSYGTQYLSIRRTVIIPIVVAGERR